MLLIGSLEQLLPAVYWQQQVRRTKNPELRKDYQAAYLTAFAFLEQHPVTVSLSSSTRESGWNPSNLDGE